MQLLLLSILLDLSQPGQAVDTILMTYGLSIQIMSIINLIKNKKRFVIIIGSVLGLMIILFLAFRITFSENFDERVFPSASGWGYEIVNRNRIIIHQEFIPCLAGEIPFASKEDAQRTARLVIKKLEEDKLPTLHKEDLELLKIKIPTDQ